MCKLYKFFKNNKSVSVGAQDFTELLDEAYILMRALTGLSWKPTSFFASYLGWHSGTIEKEANKIFSVGWSAATPADLGDTSEDIPAPEFSAGQNEEVPSEYVEIKDQAPKALLYLPASLLNGCPGLGCSLRLCTTQRSCFRQCRLVK